MMPSFRVLMTISGPYGQYTTEAIVDAHATFTCVPAPALVELGIEPHRVVRLHVAGGQARFWQMGRALTTIEGQEDVSPVLFGEPGEPAIVGQHTLMCLLLQANFESQRLEPMIARAPSSVLMEGGGRPDRG